MKLKFTNIMLSLIFLSLVGAIYFASTDIEVHKKLLKQEKLFRDSISKEIKVIKDERHVLKQQHDSLMNILVSNEKKIKDKIKTMQNDTQKIVNYTLITNDSLLKRLQSKN